MCYQNQNAKAQVCRRLLSVDEANKICERADNAVALRDRSLAGKTPPGPSASPAEDSTSLQSPSSSSITAPAGDHSAPAAGCPLSHGLRRSTIIESDLNDLLGGLFQEADTKGKVNWAWVVTMEPFAVYLPEYTYWSWRCVVFVDVVVVVVVVVAVVVVGGAGGGCAVVGVDIAATGATWQSPNAFTPATPFAWSIPHHYSQGYLTPEQLTSIMHHAELGLTGPELQLVIAEADDNADGTIDVSVDSPANYWYVFTVVRLAHDRGRHFLCHTIMRSKPCPTQKQKQRPPIWQCRRRLLRDLLWFARRALLVEFFTSRAKYLGLPTNEYERCRF